MHFGLTDEQEMIVSTVRSFVENEIYPHEALVERTGEVPPDVAQSIKQKTIDLGFYACNFPESVGGAGRSDGCVRDKACVNNHINIWLGRVDFRHVNRYAKTLSSKQKMSYLLSQMAL